MPVSDPHDPGPDDALGDVPEEVRAWLVERRLAVGGGRRVATPERALHELVAEQRRRLAALDRGLDAFDDVLRLLPDLRRTGRETLEVEFYDDRVRLRQRMEDLDELCRDELLAMRATFPAPEVLEAGLADDLRALDRGVAMLLLVSARAARSTGAARYLAAMLDRGAQIRVATTVPLHLNVVDRAVTVLALGPAPQRGERAEDVILHSSRLADCFARVFEHHWSTARPYEDGVAGDDWSPREREVLALLAAGAKDEAIARRLGCSERTLRRLITGLVARLGADSRFAAGVRAAQLGLVE